MVAALAIARACEALCGPFDHLVAAHTACLKGCHGAHGTAMASHSRRGLLLEAGGDGEALMPPWASILVSAFLVLFSGLFAGLTLGLLGLDLVALKVGGRGGGRTHAALCCGMACQCMPEASREPGQTQPDAARPQAPILIVSLASSSKVPLVPHPHPTHIGLLGIVAARAPLQILSQGGDVHERQYAAKLIPVRQKGNLLLCTLLLGNTTVNSAISIILSSVTSGVIGLVASTFIILIIGGWVGATVMGCG